jgi:hypothetical protein
MNFEEGQLIENDTTVAETVCSYGLIVKNYFHTAGSGRTYTICSRDASAFQNPV